MPSCRAFSSQRASGPKVNSPDGVPCQEGRTCAKDEALKLWLIPCTGLFHVRLAWQSLGIVINYQPFCRECLPMSRPVPVQTYLDPADSAAGKTFTQVPRLVGSRSACNCFDLLLKQHSIVKQHCTKAL